MNNQIPEDAAHMAEIDGNIFYIPARMMEGILRWINHGIVPGEFLQAIIINDLKMAVLSADYENVRNLPAYVHYFYLKAPMECWGSVGQMQQWIKLHKKLEKEKSNA